MSSILVIEDDEDFRFSIVRLLRAEGYDVHAADTGRVGLDLAHSSFPDVLLCDVLLPDLDGYSVVASLRGEAAFASLPIIFLASRKDRMDFRLGAALGVDDCITKPVDRDDLLLAVRDSLRGRPGPLPSGSSFVARRADAIEAEYHRKIAAALRGAEERHELFIVYQPQVCLATGEIVGAEALLRWENPEYGLVSPTEFIPIAEESDLILHLGELVLREACRQRESWRSSGIEDIKVGVNVSTHQLRNRRFGELVARILGETGLDPALLDLEITESALAHDIVAVATMMADLKELGVTISMDDFGTGYSGLSSLRQLPFDKLKIDRSFVTNLPRASESAAIIGALMQMARTLKIKTIAEGVETREELEYLRSIGCDQMQGFLFSRPLPPSEFVALLESGRKLK